MVKVMQYFDFLRLINIEDLPMNYLTFMSIFNENLFDFIPNWLEVEE